MRNAIETLVTVNRLREAYNAHLSFKGQREPVVITMPDAGFQTSELVRCFCLELHNWLGIEAEVNGREITFKLEN